MSISPRSVRPLSRGDRYAEDHAVFGFDDKAEEAMNYYVSIFKIQRL